MASNKRKNATNSKLTTKKAKKDPVVFTNKKTKVSYTQQEIDEMLDKEFDAIARSSRQNNCRFWVLPQHAKETFSNDTENKDEDANQKAMVCVLKYNIHKLHSIFTILLDRTL
jgi:hypothetical protein